MKIARGAQRAESPCHIRKVGRPYEPVWVIPAKGSGKQKISRNAPIGITAFVFNKFSTSQFPSPLA
jgi:hypothetical protein